MAVPCTPAGDKQVQLRRGTTAQNDAFTGADGEMSYDTQEKRMRIHDGVTAGGFRLGLKSEIDLKLNLTGGTLSGDLDISTGIHLDTDGTIIASSGAFTISSGGLISFPDNVRQVFNPGADNSGFNVGALAGDPSTPMNGDIWYDSTANELTARINGANVSLGAGGSTPPFSDSTALVMGSVTPTKLLRFEVDGFTAATTRVLTPQNADYTIAGLETFNIFTVDQVVGAAAEIILRADGSAEFASGLFTVSDLGLLSFADDVRQIFNPGATNAGLNVGALAGDPSTPVNGDLWYDSTANELTARINGVNVALGAGGSTPPFSDSTALVMGSVTPSKLLRFEVDGFTAATTRVLTPQNASYTIAGTDIAQTFTQLQTFDGDFGINIGAFMNISDPGSAGAMQISGGQVEVVGSLLALDFNVNLGSHRLFSDGSALFATGALTFSTAGLITFPDGVRQTFNPDGTTPGFNVGSFAGDPSTPSNGDLWYDSTANELTARINGVNTALGAGNYTITFSNLLALGTPADSTTYFSGLYGGPPDTTYNNHRVEVPKSGILKRVFVRVNVSGTLGSAETVQHFIRINNTTDVAQIDLSYNVVSPSGSNTSVSQAVVAGDFVALKIVTPAWATNATSVRFTAILYIE